MTSSMGVMAAEAAKVGSVVTAIALSALRWSIPGGDGKSRPWLANWQTPGVSRSEGSHILQTRRSTNVRAMLRALVDPGDAEPWRRAGSHDHEKPRMLRTFGRLLLE